MNNELKARVEEENDLWSRKRRLPTNGDHRKHTLINDLSTALQEARAESHDAMTKAQTMVGNLEQECLELRFEEKRLVDEVFKIAKICEDKGLPEIMVKLVNSVMLKKPINLATHDQALTKFPECLTDKTWIGDNESDMSELRKAAEEYFNFVEDIFSSRSMIGIIGERGIDIDVFDTLTCELRQALAATEQSEPVAWMLTSPNGTVTLFENDEEGEDAFKGWFGGSVQPLYTHPPKHEPLSDEDNNQETEETLP